MVQTGKFRPSSNVEKLQRRSNIRPMDEQKSRQMTTIKKRKRPYAQDFSGESRTDTSFSAACDVNNIVRHYETTGIDPFVSRKQQERFGEASTIPYEQAMRAEAEIRSAFALLPLPERLRYDNDAHSWFEDTLTPEVHTEPLETSPSPPADPPPEDSTAGESEKSTISP